MTNIFISDCDEYSLTAENYGETVKKIQEDFIKLKATPTEIQRAILLLEEIFVHWRENLNLTSETPVKVKAQKRFGDIQLVMKIKGDSYNPIVSAMEYDDSHPGDLLSDDIESQLNGIRLAILKANKRRLSYAYKNRKNIISIQVHALGESKKRLMRTATGLALGIITGCLLRYMLGADLAAELKTELIAPTQHIFLNAFNMLAAPVMLFSILSGMANMSGTTNIRKIGARLIGVSFMMLIVTTAVSVGAAVLMFPEDLSYMQSAIIGNGSHSPAANYALKDLFFGLVPDNIIEPFQGQNILQVLFVAIFFGLAIKKMGNHSLWILEGIETLNKFFLSVLSLVIPFVPLIVFLAMLSLTITTDLSALLGLVKILAGLALGTVCVFIIGGATVFLTGKISPVPYLKKAVGFAPIPFSINGSNASLPFVMNFTAEKLGVKRNFVSFLIPVGMQFNKTGQCFFFSMSAAMMLSVFQIELTANTLITFFISTLIMSLAKPPIPCGGIVCLNYMFGVLGIPIEAVAMIFAIEPISTLFVSIMNATSNFTATFCVARMEGEVDEKIYCS